MNDFSSLITEACADEGIDCEFLSFGYVIKLRKNGAVRHIFGRHFDLNPAAADRIACDKYACFLMLKEAGVPAVEHELFFNPLTRSNWAAPEGEFARAAAFFVKNNNRVVVKPNDGWQGRGVSYCDSLISLERALLEIFKTEPDACICPFYEIPVEYRVFYLLGECYSIYGKERAAGEWKHNLSNGANAFDIKDGDMVKRLTKLASGAARAINISFATVDIADIGGEESGGNLAVMEINAGVAANRLLEQLPERRDEIKCMYAAAVRSMFNSPDMRF
jgi:glutathione synthase/RimK-type ligase-like ATP-grasp enzyme